MKFVKVKSAHTTYPNWFMVIDSEPSIELVESMMSRMLSTAMHTMIKGSDGKPGIGLYPKTLEDIQRNAPRWATDRSTTWLLRESGTFMNIFEGLTITDECISETFPHGEFDVVICENDPENEHLGTFWKRHLGDKSAYSLNNFRHRSLEEVVSYFNSCKTIAFHTTFLNFDWWELLIEAWNLSTTKPNVIGYTGDDDDWNQAMAMAPFQATRLGFSPRYSPV